MIIHGKCPCCLRCVVYFVVCVASPTFCVFTQFCPSLPQVLALLYSFARPCLKNWISVGDQIIGSPGFFHVQGNFNVCNFFSFQMGYLGAFAKIKSITTIHCVIQVHLVLPTGVDTWRSALY